MARRSAGGGHAECERVGAPCYAACILPRYGDPTWVDLGEAAAIDPRRGARRRVLQLTENASTGDSAINVEEIAAIVGLCSP